MDVLQDSKHAIVKVGQLWHCRCSTLARARGGSDYWLIIIDVDTDRRPYTLVAFTGPAQVTVQHIRTSWLRSTYRLVHE